MDPPPYPTIPPTMTPATTTTAIINPESTNSSPRSHHNDTWDEPLPPVLGAKIRLMCSYGGHIIPSPYDKSLCYIGGDTRIVVVDRLLSLPDLHSRLSQSLLNGRAFALKYQLPSDDLDSLVSVTNDEDLENMIDEYDRMNSASPLRPTRLRLFLFPSRPETAASMGRLLDDAKSETWFVDALNDSGLLLPRGLSDSAAVDNLVELDHPEMNRDSSADVERQDERFDADDEQILIKTVHPLQPPPADVHTTLSDSPMPETNSSFESSHSSPSMSNLPPIRVRDDQSNQVLFYEQFSRMNVGSNVQKHDDGSNSMATALPPLPRFANGAVAMPMAAEAANTAAMASRKPPLPLQLVQPKAGEAHAGGYSLPSPDSVASDSSIRSGASSTKYAVYPEGNPTTNTENQVSDVAAMETQNNIPATSSHIQYQPVHESMAPFLQQQNQQQQQLIQPTLHYIQHSPTNPQMPSYYPMYVPSPSQAFHQTLDQQYQTYVLQAPQGQQYHLAVQPNNIPDNSTTPPPNQSAIPSSTTYNEIRPPLYPGQPTNYYRATTTPTLINVPSAQFQQQYFNNPQMQQPPAQPAVPANSSTAGYAYEYANQMNDQAYYEKHLTTPIAQYQTMGNQDAAAMYTQNATNSATETIAQQQAGNLQ